MFRKLPDRLMVGRLVLVQVIQVRILVRQLSKEAVLGDIIGLMKNDNKNNDGWEKGVEDESLALLFLMGTIEQHFALSLRPGIREKKLKEKYSKEELAEVCDLLAALDKKLNNEEGNYRELGYEPSIFGEKDEEQDNGS